MKLYRAYNFRTKDPAIDELRTVVEDEFGHRVNYKALSQIEKDGGPTAGTMANWFFGKVRRPQNASLEAAGRSLGYHRVWKRMNGK